MNTRVRGSVENYRLTVDYAGKRQLDFHTQDRENPHQLRFKR